MVTTNGIRRVTRRGSFRFCNYCQEPFAKPNEPQDKLGPLEDWEQSHQVELKPFLDWLEGNQAFMELVDKYKKGENP